MLPIRKASLAACVAACAVTVAPAWAQAPAPAVAPTPGFTSKPVLVSPITGVAGKELVLISVLLEPGASSPPHTHPGDCYGSVLEGTIEMRAQGKAVRRLSAGETYTNLDNVPHQFTNVGDKPVRLLNALVVDAGKPRTVTLPSSVQ